MNNAEIKKIIEALLFASPEPLTQKKINTIFNPDTPNLKKVIQELEIYKTENNKFVKY